MTVNLENIKKQLLKNIPEDDYKLREKVDRYMNLVKINQALDDAIEEEGVVVVTENGSQRFVKTHPAINEKIKINGQLLNLEKSFEEMMQNQADASDVDDLI